MKQALILLTLIASNAFATSCYYIGSTRYCTDGSNERYQDGGYTYQSDGGMRIQNGGYEIKVQPPKFNNPYTSPTRDDWDSDSEDDE